MDKLCLCSYIKTRLLLGLTATQIHDELATAYGQGVVSYLTVARWIRQFSNEGESSKWSLSIEKLMLLKV